jgi:hypothetical protein
MTRQTAPFATTQEVAYAAALDAVDAATLAASTTNLGHVVLSGPLSLSAADTITAKASGTHADGTPLTAGVSNVSVVATKADSVLLPAMTPGQVCIIANSGTADAQVFGAGTSTINGVATDTGVGLAAGKTGIFVAVTAGKIFGGALAALLLMLLPAQAQNTVTMNSISGTITSGGVAQTLAAAFPNRRGCVVQNLSTGDLWINDQGTAAAAQPSIKVPAGGQFACGSPASAVAPGAALSIFGATTAQAYSGREW